MKRLLTLTAVAASLLAAPAFAEDLTFTYTNKTGSAVTHFYASPSASNEWGDDILGRDVLNPGEAGTVTIADGERTCTYDLRSEFSDGDVVQEDKVNLCELGSYTLHER